MTTLHLLQPAFDLSDPSSLRLDLNNPKPKEVQALTEVFEADMRGKPDLGPIPVDTGWHDITPEIAVNLLRRNRPGANRKIDPATVFYYARQMAHGQWKATGQPMLFREDGVMLDAQHRVLACIISGVTIRSYVVTGVEQIPNLFAYIDNSRPRTAATALQTAGFNGVATLISKVIRLGEEVKAGVYNRGGATKLPRMAPIDMLELRDEYPNVQQAARSTVSDWDRVVEYLKKGTRKEVVAYFGMRIIDLFGEDVAEEFFDEVMADHERDKDDPIASLRKSIDKEDREKPLKKQQVLANLIHTFNAWRANRPLGRKTILQGHDDLPRFDEPTEDAEQAA